MYLIDESSVISLTLLLTLATISAVGARIAQRRKTDRINRANDPLFLGNQLDDIFCCLALLFVLPTSIIIIWGASKGAVGSHSAPSDAEEWLTIVTPEWVTLSQVVWVVLWLQPLALGCIKLSLLFFYRRLFTGKSFNIMSWALVGIVGAWMAVFTFGLFFDCGSDVAANWGSITEIDEKCAFGFLPTIVYTVLDAVLDLVILVSPLPWILRLQMSFKRKLSVIICLMLGGLCTASAFVRMAIFIYTGIPGASGNKTQIMGLPLYDAVGIVSAEMFWTMIETTVALFAICLPTIRGVVTLTQIGRYLDLSSIGRYFSKFSSYATSNITSKKSMTVATDIEMGKASEFRGSSCLEINNASNQFSYQSVSAFALSVQDHDAKKGGLIKQASVSCTECGSHHDL